MNLTGHWIGDYTYGKEYPNGVAGTSEVFEMDIKDIEGTFTGDCTDDK